MFNDIVENLIKLLTILALTLEILEKLNKKD